MQLPLDGESLEKRLDIVHLCRCGTMPDVHVSGSLCWKKPFTIAIVLDHSAARRIAYDCMEQAITAKRALMDMPTAVVEKMFQRKKVHQFLPPVK